MDRTSWSITVASPGHLARRTATAKNTFTIYETGMLQCPNRAIGLNRKSVVATPGTDWGPLLHPRNSLMTLSGIKWQSKMRRML
jgi:hypothetical protein